MFGYASVRGINRTTTHVRQDHRRSASFRLYRNRRLPETAHRVFLPRATLYWGGAKHRRSGERSDSTRNNPRSTRTRLWRGHFALSSRVLPLSGETDQVPDISKWLRYMAGPFCLVQPRSAIVRRNRPTTGHFKVAPVYNYRVREMLLQPDVPLLACKR